MRPQCERGRWIRLIAKALTIGAMAWCGLVANAEQRQAREPQQFEGLAGQLLVAAPGMRDPRFAETVIFMIEHDADGALGLVVNRRISVEPAERLLRRLAGLDPGDAGGPDVGIHYGGPVEPLQGFFLHTPDYRVADTEAVGKLVAVTRDFAILRDMTEGNGPARVFFTLGYAGWGPGQLENELHRKDWVVVPADSALIFDDDMATKWQRAFDKRGVDL